MTPKSIGEILCGPKYPCSTKDLIVIGVWISLVLFLCLRVPFIYWSKLPKNIRYIYVASLTLWSIALFIIVDYQRHKAYHDEMEGKYTWRNMAPKYLFMAFVLLNANFSTHVFFKYHNLYYLQNFDIFGTFFD